MKTFLVATICLHITGICLLFLFHATEVSSLNNTNLNKKILRRTEQTLANQKCAPNLMLSELELAKSEAVRRCATQFLSKQYRPTQALNMEYNEYLPSSAIKRHDVQMWNALEFAKHVQDGLVAEPHILFRIQRVKLTTLSYASSEIQVMVGFDDYSILTNANPINDIVRSNCVFRYNENGLGTITVTNPPHGLRISKKSKKSQFEKALNRSIQ